MAKHESRKLEGLFPVIFFIEVVGFAKKWALAHLTQNSNTHNSSLLQGYATKMEPLESSSRVLCNGT